MNIERASNSHHLAKGTLFLTSSLVIYSISGFIIHFGLSRMVSSEVYGTFGLILSILEIFQILLIKGIPDAASKYLSEGIDGKKIKKKTLILQLSFTIIISVFLFFAASSISKLLNDDGLTIYIRFLTILIPLRGINILYGYFFDGYRQFNKTAMMTILNSVPRIFFVFIFVYLGFGIFGVIGGYIASTAIGLIYGLIFFKSRNGVKTIEYSKIINFSYPIILFSIFFQLITLLDLLMLKSIGLNNNDVGYYTAARVISSGFVIISVALSKTLLPSISSSYSKSDKELTENYINYTLRYIFMLFVPVAFIISSKSQELLSLFFTPEYSNAGNALSILIFGWLFMQSFFILSSIINASGRSKIPAYITALIVLISFFGNYLLIKQFGIIGGALTTLLAGIISFGTGIFFVIRIYHVTINVSSILKIIAASLIVYTISSLVNIVGILLIPWCILLFLIYISILFFIREIKKEDIEIVKIFAHALGIK